MTVFDSCFFTVLGHFFKTVFDSLWLILTVLAVLNVFTALNSFWQLYKKYTLMDDGLWMIKKVQKVKKVYIDGWWMTDDGRKYRKYTLMHYGEKYIKYRMRHYNEEFLWEIFKELANFFIELQCPFICLSPFHVIFKASALWADAFYKSIFPSVCPSVRLSVCLFTFEVPFKKSFCPHFMK